jgi:ribosome modulation factor
MFINNDYVQQGFTAALAGLPDSECPLLFDANPRQLWLAGYTLGKLLDNEALIDPADLQRVDKDPVEQGSNAYKKNIGLIDNPYGYGDPSGNEEERNTHSCYINWQIGWNKASAEARSAFSSVDRLVNAQSLSMERLDSELVATGHNVDYYLIHVPYPKRAGVPYTAECEDLIEFAKMTFDEGCEFKAIWRTATARLGTPKPGHSAVYNAEKRVHYATRSLATEKRNAAANVADRYPV